MRRKIQRRLALVLLLCLSLTGCSFLPETLEKQWADVKAALPEGTETAGEAPVGDVTENDITRVTLYYPSADGAMLSPVTRLFWMSGDMAAEERVAEELLKAPVGEDIVAAVPEDVRLAWMEKSMGVLTMNLLCQPELEDDAARVAMAAALTATFTEMAGVEGLNILLNGRGMTLCGLPAGTLTHIGEEPARLRQHLLEEAARLDGEEDAEKPQRFMTVYCPSLTSELVVPEVRSVTLSTEDGLKTAIEELTRLPENAALTNAVPDGPNILARDPEIREESGRRLAVVYYTSEAFRALEESPVRRWQFLAAQVLTMTTFVPQIDGVRVYFGDYLVTEVPGWDGEMVSFAGGILTRSDFTQGIGAVARVYYADAQGALAGEDRVISCADVGSARALLTLLMGAPKCAEWTRTLPNGLTSADVLGVAVRGDVTEINLSANFYRLCQILDAREEALAVYSLVNTLTANGLGRAVRIFIDGQTVDTLAGTISLRGPLMPLTGQAD